MIKQSIIIFLYPLLLSLLKWCIVSIKHLFLYEAIDLKTVLAEQGFHVAICTHPSVIFGEKKHGTSRVCLLGLKVAYLKKCIKIGLLKDERGHRLMQELGMQPYFGNGVDFWFEESHSPIIPYQLPDNPKPKGKIAVYAALTGDYDNVHEVLFKEDGVDYLLFTNNRTLKSKTWKIFQVNSDLDNQLLSREIKMLPHKYLGDAYELSIYIDANAVIYGEISELTRYLNDKVSFAVSRHGERTSVRAEIDACAKLVGIDKEMALKQYNRYVEEGFKDEDGLVECGLLVRRHGEQTLQNLMETWFEEYCNGIRRDQLSLLPCINRLHFDRFLVMDGSVWHNQFERIQRHKK